MSGPPVEDTVVEVKEEEKPGALRMIAALPPAEESPPSSADFTKEESQP